MLLTPPEIGSTELWILMVYFVISARMRKSYVSSWISPVVFLCNLVVQGSSLGNFTLPNHPPQVLTMKQGNSPETATASRIRAELRQEENAGWGTWGGKPRQPQSTWDSTTATSKLEMTATKRTKESNKPWQQLRGNSQFIFFLPTQGKSSKKKIKKEKNKYRKASVWKTPSQPLN